MTLDLSRFPEVTWVDTQFDKVKLGVVLGLQLGLLNFE